MNLLDSVLCSSNCQEYTDNFKQHGIDASTLKLLSDEDLEILGIAEKEKRRLILQYAENLQITAEKQISVDINSRYVQLILAQMSVQLTKHLGVLLIAVNRSDTVVCNVKLSAATACLKNCIVSLDKQLDEFEEKVTVQSPKHTSYKKIVVRAAIIIPFMIVSFKMCQYAINKL